MPVARLRQVAPLIQAAGLHISRELGYQPSANTATRTVKNGLPEARLAKASI
jgi:hypothetical protein